MALTPKQQAFINEYMIDCNGTQAAIRAGYSPKTANEQASRLLANVNISRAVEIEQLKRSGKAGITAEYVLNGIKAIADKKFIKESDTLKAFELLGKHLKLFTEKIEEKSDQTITIKLEGEAEEWSK